MSWEYNQNLRRGDPGYDPDQDDLACYEEDTQEAQSAVPAEVPPADISQEVLPIAEADIILAVTV